MAIDLNSGTLAGPVHTSLVAHTINGPKTEQPQWTRVVAT